MTRKHFTVHTRALYPQSYVDSTHPYNYPTWILTDFSCMVCKRETVWVCPGQNDVEQGDPFVCSTCGFEFASKIDYDIPLIQHANPTNFYKLELENMLNPH